jgi:hypothetical protein
MYGARTPCFTGYAGGRGPSMRHSTHLEKKKEKPEMGPLDALVAIGAIAACDFPAGKLR